jgi:hypothetical protein
MDGTGKYKGITGIVSYTVVGLHERVGGRPALIVNHRATWEITSNAQDRKGKAMAALIRPPNWERQRLRERRRLVAKVFQFCISARRR